MKKLLTIILMAISTTVFSAYTGNASDDVTKVANISDAPNHSYITLVGKIEQHTKHSSYLFRDDSGVIIVDIDKTIWTNTGDISANDEVKIVAKLEKGLVSPELYVKAISKIKK